MAIGAMLFTAGCASEVVDKEFVVYDCLGYPGKPDLSTDGLSRLKLVYESRLLSDGRIDLEKINACISEANEAGIKTISTDIESWYWDESYSNESLKDSLAVIFDVFRKGIEGGLSEIMVYLSAL